MDYAPLRLALESIPPVSFRLFDESSSDHVARFTYSPTIEEIVATHPRFCAIDLNGLNRDNNVRFVFAQTLAQIRSILNPEWIYVDLIDLHEYLEFSHRLTYRIFGALNVRYHGRHEGWRLWNDFERIPDWYPDAKEHQKKIDENRLWNRLSRDGEHMITALWRQHFGSLSFHFWKNGIALGATPHLQQLIHSSRDWGIQINIIGGAAAVGDGWYPKAPSISRTELDDFIALAIRQTGVPIRYTVANKVLSKGSFARTRSGAPSGEYCYECSNNIMELKQAEIDPDYWHGLRQKGVCAICGTGRYGDGRDVSQWQRASVREIANTQQAVKHKCAHYQMQIEALQRQQKELEHRRNTLGV